MGGDDGEVGGYIVKLLGHDCLIFSHASGKSELEVQELGSGVVMGLREGALVGREGYDLASNKSEEEDRENTEENTAPHL